MSNIQISPETFFPVFVGPIPYVLGIQETQGKMFRERFGFLTSTLDISIDEFIYLAQADMGYFLAIMLPRPLVETAIGRSNKPVDAGLWIPYKILKNQIWGLEWSEGPFLNDNLNKRESP